MVMVKAAVMADVNFRLIFIIRSKEINCRLLSGKYRVKSIEIHRNLLMSSKNSWQKRLLASLSRHNANQNY